MLALAGVNLALGGRSREKLDALEEGIRVSGGRALIVGTHLAKRHHPAYLVGAALELSHELSEEGIRASEVRLEDPGRVGPEQCAESVCRLLANPPDASAGGFTVRRVPEA
jgi:hypothetical protein